MSTITFRASSQVRESNTGSKTPNKDSSSFGLLAPHEEILRFQNTAVDLAPIQFPPLRNSSGGLAKEPAKIYSPLANYSRNKTLCQPPIPPQRDDNGTGVAELSTVTNAYTSLPTIGVTGKPPPSQDKNESYALTKVATLTGNLEATIVDPSTFKEVVSAPQKDHVLFKKICDAFETSRKLQTEDNAMQTAEKLLREAQRDPRVSSSGFQKPLTEKKASERAKTVKKARDLLEWTRTNRNGYCTELDQAIQELCCELSKSRAANQRLDNEVTTLKGNFERFKEETVHQVNALNEKLGQEESTLAEHANTFRQVRDMLQAYHIRGRECCGPGDRAIATGLPDQDPHQTRQTSHSALQSVMSGPIRNLDGASAATAVEEPCLCVNGVGHFDCKAQEPLPKHGEMERLRSWIRYLESEQRQTREEASRANLALKKYQTHFDVLKASVTEVQLSQDATDEEVTAHGEILGTNHCPDAAARWEYFCLCMKDLEERLGKANEETRTASDDQAIRTESRIKKVEGRLERTIQKTWRDQATKLAEILLSMQKQDASDKIEIHEKLSHIHLNHVRLYKNLETRMENLTNDTVSSNSLPAVLTGFLEDNLNRQLAIMELRDYMSQNQNTTENTTEQLVSTKQNLNKLEKHIAAAKKTFGEEMIAMKKSVTDLRQDFNDSVKQAPVHDTVAVTTVERQSHLAISTDEKRVQHEFSEALQRNLVTPILKQVAETAVVIEDQPTTCTDATEVPMPSCEVPSLCNIGDEEATMESTRVPDSPTSTALSVHSDGEFSEFQYEPTDTDRSSRSASPSPRPRLRTSRFTSVMIGKRKFYVVDEEDEHEDKVDELHPSTINTGPEGIKEIKHAKTSKRVRKETSVANPEIFEFSPNKTERVKRKAFEPYGKRQQVH